MLTALRGRPLPSRRMPASMRPVIHQAPIKSATSPSNVNVVTGVSLTVNSGVCSQRQRVS